jgi:hypothetical protein
VELTPRTFMDEIIGQISAALRDFLGVGKANDANKALTSGVAATKNEIGT